MKATIEVTEADFETEVLKSNDPVVVEFAVAWSLPSVALETVLDGIGDELLDYLKLVRVRLDQSPNLGLWYGIRCIPTILCFVDGEERVGIFGPSNKEAILAHLGPVIASRRSPQEDC